MYKSGASCSERREKRCIQDVQALQKHFFASSHLVIFKPKAVCNSPVYIAVYIYSSSPFFNTSCSGQKAALIRSKT